MNLDTEQIYGSVSMGFRSLFFGKVVISSTPWYITSILLESHPLETRKSLTNRDTATIRVALLIDTFDNPPLNHELKLKMNDSEPALGKSGSMFRTAVTQGFLM